MGLREAYQAKGATLTPAGIWKRDKETGKKLPIVAFRKDGLSFDDYPKDNIAKFRIEEATSPDDMRLLIIDADSQEGLDRAYKLFPQAKDTFSTQTSQSYKRHFWFFVPTDKFEELRAIGALEDIDILTYGILFEAHFFNEDSYQMPDFTKEILVLDDKSQGIILASLDNKNTSYGRGIHQSFTNKEMAFLVAMYVDDKLEIIGDTKEAMLNSNNLFKQLTPKTLKKKGQRNFPAPELNHDNLNTMSLLVAKNAKIPNDIAIKFIEKLLVEVYKLNLNSKLTQVHFYNSILPTLPFFEKLYSPLEDFSSFDELVESNSTDNTKDSNFKWVLFATAKSGSLQFFQMNKFTYRLRVINGSSFLENSYIKSMYPNLAKDDLEDIPHLALMTNPYEDIVIFDDDNHIYLLNTIHPSKYKVNAVANKSKPDNILIEMVDKFFSNGLHSDFYYHWLAHLLFGDKPVNVVVWLCSDVNAEAGTGKTILSAALPAQLIGEEQATTVDSSVASSGWGQIYDTKLLSFNDLNKMRDTDWDKLYAKIKDEASNSTSKIRNNKGGEVVKSSIGICQSGSSNFVPRVDSSDRRFFIVSPKEKLDQHGADELHRIFESERTNEHSEVQELADYLAYLYLEQRDKYKTELYTRAIMTAEKTASTQMGAYTHTIIARISKTPKELFDIFKETTSYTDEWQDWQIITFIKLQSNNGKVYLPTPFLNYLINRVKGTDESRAIASVMSTLEMKKSKLPVKMTAFKEDNKLGLPREIAGYPSYGIITNIDEEAYKNFMPNKLTAKGIAKLGEK